MWKKIIAMCLALTLPSAVSAGPLKAAAEKAGREIALSQSAMETRSRSRFWTGVALIAGGGALALLSAEFGDDETGPDDGEDSDDSDDGEDSDGWGTKRSLAEASQLLPSAGSL